MESGSFDSDFQYIFMKIQQQFVDGEIHKENRNHISITST